LSDIRQIRIHFLPHFRPTTRSSFFIAARPSALANNGFSAGLLRSQRKGRVIDKRLSLSSGDQRNV
jgi:hypothetical protein